MQGVDRGLIISISSKSLWAGGCCGVGRRRRRLRRANAGVADCESIVEHLAIAALEVDLRVQ